MNVRDLHMIHRRHLAAVRRSPETLRFYEASVKQWELFCSATARDGLVAGMTRRDLQEVQLWMRGRGLAPGGEHAILRGLRALMTWGLDEELITQNPFGKFRMPSLPEEPPPTVQPSQVAELLRLARLGPQPLRDVAMLMTLFDTGVRMGEVVGLRCDDVDMVAGSITVRAETAKREKGRMVPVGIKAARAIASYERKERRPARASIETLFLSRDGMPLTRGGLTQLILRLTRAAGITRAQRAPHAFRRGFAVSFLRSGGDIFALQQILGHASLQMTRRYVTYLPDDLQRQHARFSPADRL